MCKVLEDYSKWETKQTLFRMIESGKVPAKNCEEELHMTETEILDEMEKEGYKVPEMA